MRASSLSFSLLSLPFSRFLSLPLSPIWKSAPPQHFVTKQYSLYLLRPSMFFYIIKIMWSHPRNRMSVWNLCSKFPSCLPNILKSCFIKVPTLQAVGCFFSLYYGANAYFFFFLLVLLLVVCLFWSFGCHGMTFLWRAQASVWICLMSPDYQTVKRFGKNTTSVTRVLPAVSHEETLGVSV